MLKKKQKHYYLPNHINNVKIMRQISFQHDFFFKYNNNLSALCKIILYEPPHDKTNKMACGVRPAKGHPPSLIRVFSVRMKKAWVLSYPLSAQRRLWSDWADAQTDLSVRWAHNHFVGFVMRQLIRVLRHGPSRLFHSFRARPIKKKLLALWFIMYRIWKRAGTHLKGNQGY